MKNAAVYRFASQGIFKCFGCSEGGNSCIFIMKQEQLYHEAPEISGQKYHIEVRERELSDEGTGSPQRPRKHVAGQ